MSLRRLAPSAFSLAMSDSLSLIACSELMSRVPVGVASASLSLLAAADASLLSAAGWLVTTDSARVRAMREVRRSAAPRAASTPSEVISWDASLYTGST